MGARRSPPQRHRMVGARCTHAAIARNPRGRNTPVFACPRGEDRGENRTRCTRAHRPISPKLLILKEHDLAERVGFVPAIPAPINDLGLIGSPQSTKSTQSLSIRYRSGTAQSRWRGRTRARHQQVRRSTGPDLAFFYGRRGGSTGEAIERETFSACATQCPRNSSTIREG